MRCKQCLRASNFFKQQQSKYFKERWEIVISTENYILNNSFYKLRLCVVKHNCDLTRLSAMKTIVQCSKSFR